MSYVENTDETFSINHWTFDPVHFYSDLNRFILRGPLQTLHPLK